MTLLSNVYLLYKHQYKEKQKISEFQKKLFNDDERN